MKNIKSNKGRYLVATAAIGMALFSCTKGFEDLNVTPDRASVASVTIPGLFNGISKDITNGNDAVNIFLLLDISNQQAVQNEVASTAIYNSGLWTSYYPILFDYKKLQKLITQNPAQAEYSNVKYMADILMASKTLQMLDFYGDIPYSQAGLADSAAEYRRPAYDNQEDVYVSVLADLKAAADGIKIGDATQVNIGASESFLASDYAAWVRFANALRLRYAVRLYDKDQALSTAIITDIIGGNKPLPANQQASALEKNNFGFWPGKVNPVISTDRIWGSFRENSITKLRMSSNVWAQMSSNNNTDGSGIFDPRTKVWFMTNNDDLWIPQPQDHSVIDGGDPYPNDGVRPAIGSDPDNKFAAFNINLVNSPSNYPYLIISEADVYFLKAEIYQRGMGVAKDIAAAKAAYEAGIKSNVDFWYAQSWIGGLPAAPAPAEMTTFLAVPSVAYDGSNDADALRKIATQAWLATIWEPQEAWAIVRRTGLTPTAPGYSPAGKANKLPYPGEEETNNNANWKTVLGGGGMSLDQQAQIKVYWMP